MSTSHQRASRLASTPRTTAAPPRAAGAWGWAFVLLLLLSAGMASVPGGADSTGVVRDFYTRHTGVVIVAQIVGLLAAAAFVPFVLGLRRTEPRRPRAALENAGLGVAAAAVLTAVPVLWLSTVADSGSDGFVHGLAVASDLADVLLFAVISVWAALLVRAARPTWFKVLAGVLAVLALARAVLLLAGSGALELVAPLAFVVVVDLISTLVLARRSPLRR
jgi:hypothetical protein